MATYNTGNPLGSVAVKDLFDNAQNLDRAVNSKTSGTWTDRFGVERKTWKGIEDKAAFDIATAVAKAVEEGTVAAEGFRDESAQARDESRVARDAAQEARADAVAAAGAIGPIEFYDTYAQALDAAAGEKRLIEVARDETREGARTRYWAEAGALRFAVNLDQLREDLSAAEDGLGMVSWKRRPLALAASAASRMLSGQATSIWEFVDKIVDKADPIDPATWDWTPAIQAALDASIAPIFNGNVSMPPGDYLYTNLRVPASLRSWEGAGCDGWGGTRLRRKAGSVGVGIVGDLSARNTHMRIAGFRLDGNKEAGETYGFDITGFSYCIFENLFAYGHRLDGIFNDATPYPGQSLEPICNTFINVRSIGNGRDGVRSLSSYSATYIGGEFGGNGQIGLNDIGGVSTQLIGGTLENNGVRDLFVGGRRGKYDFYCEGVRYPVELGSTSEDNEVSCLSGWPMWQTFIDNGTNNKKSIRGENQSEINLFNNPHFLNWTGVDPVGISRSDSGDSFSSIPNAALASGAEIGFTFDGDYSAIYVNLSEVSSADLAGKWVTLIVDADTSGYLLSEVIGPTDSQKGQVVADGNLTPGQYAALGIFPRTAAGQYRQFAYDVKFPATLVNKRIVVRLNNGYPYGVTNTIKIRSIHVVLGRTMVKPSWTGLEAPIAVTTSALANAALGVNTHRKKSGKMAYDSATGKLYFAIGASATVPWRPVSGTGDLIPA